MLTSQYSGSGGAREYNLMIALYQLQQETGESITTFHNCMRFL